MGYDSELLLLTARQSLLNMSVCLTKMAHTIKEKKKRKFSAKWLLRRESEGFSHKIVKEFLDEDAKLFKTILRMTPVQFQFILELVSPHIKKEDTNFKKAISPAERLQVTLAYLATDTRLDGYFLMGSPLIFFTILAFYLYFVLNLGPKLMKNRKPFQLNRILMIYNIIQVISNAILGSLATIHVYKRYGSDLKCITCDFSENGLYEAQLTYCYYLLKVADLFDTVFFILRKKNNQVSFLHLYHHCAILFGAYLFAQYIPGGHGAFLGIVNCFVHAFMYFYYFITSINPNFKNNIWWKKYITQIQIIQFVLIILFFIPPLIDPNCSYTKFGLLLGVIQNAFMLFMFADFYKKAYLSNKKIENKIN